MARHNLEKQLSILDFALSSLWRHRMKSLSVLLVFAAVIFLLASFQMVTQALSDKAKQVLAHTPEITLQKMSAGRQESIPLAYGEQLAGIFGIRRVVPRIWGYYFDEVRLANYTVMGLEVNEMPEGGRLGATLAKGVMPGPADEAQGRVVVGQSIKKTMDLAGRTTFSLFRPDLSLKPFEISGEFSPDTDILTNDLIVMNVADARDLFGIPAGLVTDLCVYVANPKEIETIAKKISEALPSVRVLTRSQIQKTYQVVFGWRSGFGSICLLAALAAFVILAWDKASGLSPEERREIAILKVLGWETSDILAVRSRESVIVSGLACIVGMTAAYIHVVYFDAALFRPVLMGWSVLRPDLHLLPRLAAGDILLILAFTVIPYLAATVIPAWRSATVPADSALGG
ncbi:MAG: FtsX-like permease family protein [Proteobacteria bacterium]|nr:FtsX-like permease family protein [Pseudomonadota bacterium]MBU2618919.1 FtsX-like permease family protein [Pseudomonadota bacterium]